MATSRTLFIPWDRAQSGTFASEHSDADHSDKGSAHRKRKVTVICRDTPGKPLAKIGAGIGTRIHVVGHGAIGDPELGADHGTGAADVGIEELVDMMFEKGLKKYYLGTVACDVCYSAIGSPSYAKMLARELYKRGLKASCVLGYKGPLISTYHPASQQMLGGSKYTHRMVYEMDENDNRVAVHKSSKMQERFFGFN
ncbi:hypothetical protein NZK35_23035 [Stieleria sp. ICT_E10.1]|uniref:hypothetical protein n=1 Tax=Stieleria sedimenti TaxID=2976331 RepID=UPI00217FBA2D|nr:hypothetical protein [Stieleria sedimenti]MCS7469538.1 hypothetical protein [Stieleria sedimenti]